MRLLIAILVIFRAARFFDWVLEQVVARKSRVCAAMIFWVPFYVCTVLILALAVATPLAMIGVLVENDAILAAWFVIFIISAPIAWVYAWREVAKIKF